MLDPLDNPEIAAASKVRGDRFGQYGRILLLPNTRRLAPTANPETPRAVHSRGVRVFAPIIPAPTLAGGRFLTAGTTCHHPRGLARKPGSAS